MTDKHTIMGTIMTDKLTCTKDDKEYAKRCIVRIVDEIESSESRLEAFISKLNLMDVRHDDFASDADLQEFRLSLRDMSKTLMDTVQPGGYLDQHFDRPSESAQ